MITTISGNALAFGSRRKPWANAQWLIRFGSGCARRLRQMRQRAQQFRGRVKAINRGEVNEDLRLVPKPIYRYKSEDRTLLDGAIFSFVRGTDPEALLLIEARKVDESTSWQYAFAPMNSFEFTAFHQDRKVWHIAQRAPPWPSLRDPTTTCFMFHFERQLLEATP